MQQTHIAISIFLGSILIAGAILLKDYSNNSSGVVLADSATKGELQRSENPHTYGDEDAPIRIVEFSDFECPFCARLHPTLKQIVDESDGEIVWEYRHLPLPNHTNAFAKAVASECVSTEVGNDAFWSFADTILSSSKSGEDYYVDEAVKLGADEEKFRACLQDESMEEVVRNDLHAAQSNGGRGTPFSVIVTEEGIKPVSGALPYENWMQILKTLN